MQNTIELVLAAEEDANLLHEMKLKSFMPLYEKYHDEETNPVKETWKRMLEKITEPCSDYYMIYFDGKPVGGIRVRHYQEEETGNYINRISPLFVVPEFQNRGIGQSVLRKIFILYPQTVTWRLDTIKQETGNCHLYEKFGFVKTGEEHVINALMTLVDYEKKMI